MGLPPASGWKGAGPLWVLGSASLLDGIFTNLLSNLLRARADGEMRLTLSPDRTLRYADDGPGMDPTAVRALLEQGRPTAELLDRGALGLLLVRDYAAALGWQITVEQGAGLRLCFRLPPAAGPCRPCAAGQRRRCGAPRHPDGGSAPGAGRRVRHPRPAGPDPCRCKDPAKLPGNLVSQSAAQTKTRSALPKKRQGAASAYCDGMM